MNLQSCLNYLKVNLIGGPPIPPRGPTTARTTTVSSTVSTLPLSHLIASVALRPTVTRGLNVSVGKVLKNVDLLNRTAQRVFNLHYHVVNFAYEPFSNSFTSLIPYCEKLSSPDDTQFDSLFIQEALKSDEGSRYHSYIIERDFQKESYKLGGLIRQFINNPHSDEWENLSLKSVEVLLLSELVSDDLKRLIAEKAMKRFPESYSKILLYYAPIQSYDELLIKFKLLNYCILAQSMYLFDQRNQIITISDIRRAIRQTFDESSDEFKQNFRKLLLSHRDEILNVKGRWSLRYEQMTLSQYDEYIIKFEKIIDLENEVELATEILKDYNFLRITDHNYYYITWFLMGANLRNHILRF